MMPVGRPRFEVVVGTANAVERRLVTADIIRALTGIPASVNDTTLNLMIDATLAQCATYCRLARDGAKPITLAQESVRATWQADAWLWPAGWYPYYGAYTEPSTLLLPWRTPITSIAITDGETELVENTDFRLLGAGVVERMAGVWPTTGSVVIDYIAGWVPLSDDPSYDYDGETMPADLVALIADQIRLANDRRDIDLNLRSEDVPNVWSGTYNLAGGDTIGESGLLRTLEDALTPFRAPASFA